jgi:hypothetical protein
MFSTRDSDYIRGCCVASNRHVYYKGYYNIEGSEHAPRAGEEGKGNDMEGRVAETLQPTGHARHCLPWPQDTVLFHETEIQPWICENAYNEDHLCST